MRRPPIPISGTFAPFGSAGAFVRLQRHFPRTTRLAGREKMYYVPTTESWWFPALQQTSIGSLAPISACCQIAEPNPLACVEFDRDSWVASTETRIGSYA